MKKFIFKSFDANAFEEKSLMTYQDYLDSKILNVFLMDDSKTLVVLSIKEIIDDTIKKYTTGGDTGREDVLAEAFGRLLKTNDNTKASGQTFYQTY